MSARTMLISRRPIELYRRKPTFPCKKCQVAFGSRMELEEHSNTHTGRRPFICDVCNATFTRRSSLWNHKRTHGDRKPFVCPICSHQFKWKNSLQCHSRVHVRKREAKREQFDFSAQTFTSGNPRSRTTKRPSSARSNDVAENGAPPVKRPKREGKSWLKNVAIPVEIQNQGKLPDMSTFAGCFRVFATPSPVPPIEDVIWALGDQNDDAGGVSLFLTRTMEPTQATSCVMLPTICLPETERFTAFAVSGVNFSGENSDSEKIPSSGNNGDHNYDEYHQEPQGMYYDDCRFVSPDEIGEDGVEENGFEEGDENHQTVVVINHGNINDVLATDEW